MTITLVTYPYFHADDSSGNPLAAGRVYSYVVGTSTLKTTYSDSACTVANTNPVVLNERGDARIFVNALTDLVLKTNEDTTIWGPITVGA